MEELLAQQENTLCLIKKMGVNFKKSPIARLTKGYIQTRLETVSQYWEQFRQVHSELTKVTSASKKKEIPYFVEDYFDKGEEEYLNTKTDMQDKLEALLNEKNTETGGDRIPKQEVKLPQINIPQFSGHYSEWSTFRDLFNSLINENKGLSSVQKLHYLKSSMSGEADQLLKHIPITERNFEIAWTTLTNRYNNKRVIVNSILNKLFNQKKLSSGSARGIKELMDTTNECINNLKSNDVSVLNWDIIVIYMLVNKLDEESHKSWEEELGSLPVDNLPSLKTFIKYLETRFRVLEMIQTSSTNRETRERVINKPKSFVTTTSAPTSFKCTLCNENHGLIYCKKFTDLSVTDRVQHVTQSMLCFNCLSPKHSAKFCRSQGTCKQCNRRHHTLLHYQRGMASNTPTSTETERGPETKTQPETEISGTIKSHLVTQGQNSLMATALVHVETGQGLQLVRALIDPCSQESFISEETAQRLQLRRKFVKGHVTGVDQMTSKINYAAEIQVHSRINKNFKLRCVAFVVRQVTDVLPGYQMSHESWTHLQNLSLADPTYHQPASVDLLLGVNVYTDILMSGVIRGEPGSPIAQQTQLGWIISGGVQKETGQRGIVSMHLNLSLDGMLERFWESERLESEENDSLTPLEVRAEEIYDKTVMRESNGRYVVALPFKSDTPILPEKSREIAMRSLRQLEKRLSTNEKLRTEYNRVMQEYINLKHIETVNENEPSDRAVYLPHHAVVREDKDTTKVRVVYNASQEGENGVSLNEQLLIGPSLQQELRDTLLRWRMHKTCFIADIIKMYRQIRVRREDVDYQRIVWRFRPEDPVKDYRLLTVTFGTACAPYLAIKTLKQIAKDEGQDEKFSRAIEIINHDFYVDDCLSGSHDEDTAIEVQRELTEVLKRGGFELQKWCSNSEKFMNEIEPERRANGIEVNLNRKAKVKTLGIIWNVREDELQVTSEINILEDKKITKRNVVSVIASLFDPMGWLAPVIALAKIFMQKLWILGLSWDEELPIDYCNEWIEFRSQIPILELIQLPRWIGTTNKNQSIELHGFADASTLAYAAVIYSRVITSDGRVETSLLMAKTKVAPVKQITLPRLELCAAVLLSKLLKHVATAMRIPPDHTYAWSDSQIVLAWIRGDPLRWKPYVKNRVIEISNTIQTTWSYVGTKENPADPASRGIVPEKLKDNELWWSGPSYLKQRDYEIHTCKIPETDVERREIITCATMTVKPYNEDDITSLLRRYSSLKKLVAVVAWILRWLHLKREKISKDNLPAFVNYEERKKALTTCIKLSQKVEFAEEMEQLRNGKPLMRKSRLSSLTPFLDEQGVLRVGGRLKYTDFDFLSKHPIIISKNNALLQLLLFEAHEKTLHGGPQMMVTHLRTRYWLIDAGNSVKKFARNCMTCAKQRTVTRTQLMGALPECRVKPSRPFSITGVDFAGPINARLSKGRGSKSFKAYISLFICMVTKAIHIELVSDMTTEAFMAAYRRFTSRRGICKEMWSDHGTTFVAASKVLIEMWKQGRASVPEELRSLLDKEGTKWKFIPPGAPNFGGLWEAGVKSIKFHLKRTMEDSTLTFEELNTLLIQIEATLNSRPLSPISDDPRDLEPLTPAHFLVGEPLNTIPERPLLDVKMHSLTRWQLIQRMTQAFWKKWQSEYLNRLQQRPKWSTIKKEFGIGDLVLLKDHRCPPSKWLLGRIVTKYPGRDALTRTYDVRTHTGVYTRTVTKLCPLPDV